MSILLVCYIIINVFSFFAYGIDKVKAIKHSWRISEKKLLYISLFGPIGAIIAMIVFRHKIRKYKFILLVPLILFIHILIYYYIINYYSIVKIK